MCCWTSPRWLAFRMYSDEAIGGARMGYRFFSAFSVLLVSALPAHADILPLQAGAYATDPSYCDVGINQLEPFGEAASSVIRWIDGTVLDYPFAALCEAENIRVLGSDLVFDLVCGDGTMPERQRVLWLLQGDTGFNDGGSQFSLCGVDAATAVDPAGDIGEAADDFGRAVTDADAVTSVQVALTRLGYAPGPWDGRLGPATISALNGFQRDNGLPVTPYVTEDAARAVVAAEQVLWDEAESTLPDPTGIAPDGTIPRIEDVAP